MKKFFLLLAVALGVAWTACNFIKASDQTSSRVDCGSLTTVLMPESIPSQIKEYTGYTVSFNPQTHCPNWVAWELTADETRGVEPRAKRFWTDTDIDGCAQTSDYRNTGFDRGHMAPAGDMKWSNEAMNDCFSLANICPQTKSLNSGTWGKLEEKCRKRAQADSVVIIVCGPVPGEEPSAHIGLTGVAVPQRFFKVILSPTTTPPMAIGFIMPNGYVKGGMQGVAVSVDSVETLTGYDFFSPLPDDIEDRVEAQCNFPKWSRTR